MFRFFIFLFCFITFLAVRGNLDADFSDILANEEAFDNVFESLADFFEDSGCSFSCPDGQRAIPRAGFKASHNGCGSYGFKIKSSNLPEMTECCNTHDACYETCNIDRETCDNQFKTCLENMCVKKKHAVPDCEATADMMYKGAVTLGCKAYKEGQITCTSSKLQVKLLQDEKLSRTLLLIHCLLLYKWHISYGLTFLTY
ncbi:hypothetical protein KUTeg_003225 [Tegillarca granosa]|uniref:Phospholipase A(2) n=1 Tax=Tegillarca granosa TaxID=220873 RepID=A0ABQ9FLJ6_TEGGR|nr:hypothetical protein KUTeg_003225 [Tegillarca granosa]